MIRLILAALLLLTGAPVAAAILSAGPATLAATLARAKPGDTIALAASDYAAVTINRVAFDPPVTVDAAAARLTSLRIVNTQGLEWVGGRLTAPREQAAGVTIDASARVQVASMTLTGPRVGITAVRSSDIRLVGNRFDGIRSDGINFTQIQRLEITGNQCVNFQPIPATYDAAGRLLVDGDHADCIQGWSTAGTPPVADVKIIGNVAVGPMQGIWMGNAGQGGYDRVTIRFNDLQLGAFNGIAVYEGRGTVITDNRLRAVPGARLAGGNRGLIRPWIYTTGSDVTACGNVVAEIPNGDGTAPCPVEARR